MNIQTFLAGAVIIEGLISWGSVLFVDKKVQPKAVCALVLGILLAFDLQINVFTLAGIEEVYPLVGTVLTGVLISRGSNYVSEIARKLESWKKLA